MFGCSLDKRPVAVPVCTKLECTRPLTMHCRKLPTAVVLINFFNCRCSRISCGSRCPVLSINFCSVASSVDFAPVEVRGRLKMPASSFNFSKSWRLHSSGDGMKVAPSRDKCKRTVYAAIYGVGPETLATQLGRGTTVSQATVMLSSFGKRFPNIAKLRKAVVAQCRKHGFTETLLKRRRYFRKGTILSADFSKRMAAERQCFNHVLQGSAADVTKVAMIRVQERLHAKKLDARLLLQIHDELVLECATAEVAVCAGELAAAMQTAVSVSLPLPVVIKIGPSWGL